MGYQLDRLDNVIAEFTVATSTGAAAQLAAASAWTGLTPDQQQSLCAVQITNMDPTNLVLLGNSAVAANAFWYPLLGYGILPTDLQRMGRKPFTQIYALAASGTPGIRVKLLAG